MEKEYIEREVLERSIHTGMNIIEAMQSIIDAPAADVRPVVRGKWKFSFWFHTCSECNYQSSCNDDEGLEIPLNFCPSCGADMREFTGEHSNI